MSDLNQAQLLKRSRELDAREEFIDAKAKILKDGPLTLKVYDARVKASEDTLEQLRKDIKEAGIALNNLRAESRHVVVESQRRKESLEAELNQLDNDKKDAKRRLDNLQAEGDDTEKQIIERKNYLESQEKVINQAINEGNEKLLDINDEVLRQEGANKQLESDHTALKSDLDEAVVAADGKKAELVRELEDLKLQKRNLQQEIDNLAKRIEEKSAEFKRTSEEVDSKLAQLKEKEDSLIAKRDAIVLERQELDRDKRRWSSTKALYDV